MLQGSYQVLLNTEHNSLAHECSQPLLAAWADHVVYEKERYAEILTSELGTDGAEVSDILIGCVIDDDTQGIILLDVFCHTIEAFDQLKVLYEEGVMELITRRILLDEFAVKESALIGLPLETTMFISQESFDKCEQELRETIPEDAGDKDRDTSSACK